MVQHKTKSKSASKSKPHRTSKKKRIPPPLDLKAISSGHIVVYGDPLRRALARGEINEMRKVAVIARRWLKDVEGALRKLEAAIKRVEQ